MNRESQAQDRVRVRPKEGMRIRDEYTLQHIPAEGMEVKRTRYVERLLAAGDLEPIESAAQPGLTRERLVEGEAREADEQRPVDDAEKEGA